MGVLLDHMHAEARRIHLHNAACDFVNRWLKDIGGGLGETGQYAVQCNAVGQWQKVGFLCDCCGSPITMLRPLGRPWRCHYCAEIDGQIAYKSGFIPKQLELGPAA
jgi:hypothetical protein